MRDIAKAYRMLVARARGEVTAEVTLAEQASETHLSKIKAAIAEVTGKDCKSRPRWIPGDHRRTRRQAGSRMVDASIRTKLNAIKHAMKEVS